MSLVQHLAPNNVIDLQVAVSAKLGKDSVQLDQSQYILEAIRNQLEMEKVLPFT